jgi:hypothetical protein
MGGRRPTALRGHAVGSKPAPRRAREADAGRAAYRGGGEEDLLRLSPIGWTMAVWLASPEGHGRHALRW